MSTQYLSIQALQEPGDLGVPDDDPEHRQAYGFNVLAYRTASATYVEELLEILEDAGVGVAGGNLVGTSQPEWPAGPGPYLRIEATPGTSPVGTLADRAAFRRPGARIETRASNAGAAYAMAMAAYAALVAVTNRRVEVAS